MELNEQEAEIHTVTKCKNKQDCKIILFGILNKFAFKLKSYLAHEHLLLQLDGSPSLGTCR